MKLPAWHSSGNREQAWKNSMNGLGKKLMASMGWREGEALGSKGNDGNGLLKCLQPDVENFGKSETRGIGSNKSIHSSNWWEDAFKNAASDFDCVGKKKKDKKRKDKSSSSKKSKKSKTETPSSPETVKNRDGTNTSASANELRIIESLSKDKWGFTGGREGKMERIRRQEQEYLDRMKKAEEAKAESTANINSTTSKVSKETKTSPTPSRSSKKDKVSKKQSKKARKEEKAKAKADRKAELLYKKEMEAKSRQYAEEGSWWGSKLFSFSGILGRVEKEVEKKGEAEGSFVSEKDQVKAFYKAKQNAVYDHSGIGSQFLDIKLGEEFRGEKKTFGEEEEGGKGANAGDGSEDEGSGSGSGSGSDSDDTVKIKWKKAFKKVLEGEGGTPVHIDTLKSKVIGKQLKRMASEQERSQLEATFLKKLSKNKRLARKKDMIQYK